MSDPFMDRFIADLVKGAEGTEGFMRGGRVGVEVSREHRGREEKLAYHPNFAGAANALGYVGGMASGAPLPGMLAAPISAGLSAAPGSGLSAMGGSLAGMGIGGLAGGVLGGMAGAPGLGAILGGGLGSSIGAHMGGKDDRSVFEKVRDKLSANKDAGLGGALGGMVGPIGAAAVGGLQDQSGGSAFGSGAGSLIGAPTGAAVGGLGGAGLGAIIARIAQKDPAEGAALGAALGLPIGAIGGSMLGAHLGQNHMCEGAKQGALVDDYVYGVEAAAATFGIKEAFIPTLIGNVAAGAATKRGLNAIASRAGGSTLGNLANKGLDMANAGGVRGALFDQGTAMAGGAIGSRFEKQQGPQGP